MKGTLAIAVFLVWAVVVGITLTDRNYTILGVVTPVLLTVIGYYFHQQTNGKKA